MEKAETELVRVGRVAGAFGVRGWVRVVSDTDPSVGILGYRPWRMHLNGAWVEMTATEGRQHPRGVVVKLEGCDDRDAAERYRGAEIAVRRDQLPVLGEREFYWVDLIGATVVTTRGRTLGQVKGLIETGANDVLVVEGDRQRLIPFIDDEVVSNVDLGVGRITVDWDPEF